MGLARRILSSITDVRHFSPRVLRRHLRNADGLFTVRVAPYGEIHLRADSADLELARLVLVNGAYDFPWPKLALDRLEGTYGSILEKGRVPVIVNAGGHIGLSALWFASRWPEAQVVSVEPDQRNLELLRKNVAGRPRHTVIETALGNKPGKASIAQNWDPSAAQTERTDSGVDVITVMDAVARVKDGEPFICNIDIEGFEQDLFAANTEWIDGFALIVIEPHDWSNPGAMLSRNFLVEMARRRFDLFVRRSLLYFLRV